MRPPPFPDEFKSENGGGLRRRVGLPALSNPHCMLLRQTRFADALLYFRNVIFRARRIPRLGGAIVNGIGGARVAVARLPNGARVDDQPWFQVHRRANSQLFQIYAVGFLIKMEHALKV